MKALKNRFFKRTIATDLIIGLAIAIILVVFSLGLFYYYHYAAAAEDELKSRASRLITDFADDVAWPLFNFDVETALQIAKRSLRSEIIAGIKINIEQTEVFNSLYVEEQTEVFNSLSAEKKGLFTQEAAIFWEDKPVGYVQMQFSRARLQLASRRLVKTVATILISVVLVMGLAVSLILKILLERPLRRLINAIRAIGADDYEKPLAPGAHADIKAIINTINDMAAKIKKRSQQLMESEKKYRSIFENAAEGICQATVEGRFMSANPALAHILGYSSASELIQHIDDIGTQLYAEPEERKSLLKLHLRQETVQGFETQFRHKNGGTVWVSITSRAVANENGRISFFEAFVQDITHRKKMQLALEKAKDELEDRVRQRTHALEEKTVNLERINRLFIDRELQMKKLKAELKDLKEKFAMAETVF